MQKKTTQNTLSQFIQNENLEKVRDSSEEPRAYQMNYACLVICLSAIFDKTSPTEIANFGRKYRSTLKEIFRDILDYDIPAEAIRQFLTLLNSQWIFRLLEDLLQPISEDMDQGTLKYVGRRPIFPALNSLGFSSLLFFPTANGIAFGQKRHPHKREEVDKSFVYNLDINSTVITLKGAVPQSDDIAKSIIEKRAEYLLEVTEKQEELFKEIQAAFNDPLNATNKTGEIEQYQNESASMRSITVLPAKLLGTASLKKWDGLASGSLVKEIRKKAEQKTGDAFIKESFYISSFVPDNPCIAEHVARGIWGAPDVPNSFWYLFSIDAFQDISQSKNVNYVQNCERLRNAYSGIRWSLKERTKKTYEAIKREEERKVSKAKDFFVDLIYELTCRYVEKYRREDEEAEEYERKHPLRYF